MRVSPHCSSTLQQLVLFPYQAIIGEKKSGKSGKVIFFMIRDQSMGKLVCPGPSRNWGGREWNELQPVLNAKQMKINQVIFPLCFLCFTLFNLQYFFSWQMMK